MIFNRERPSFETANNVTVKRCYYAYQFSNTYIKPQHKVVDIGCANGYGTVDFTLKSNNVIGLDYSKQTIADASKKQLLNKRITFRQAKVPPIPMDENSVDILTSFQFIEHIEQREEFVKEAHRCLKTGGQFICTTPNRLQSFARNPYHVFEYTFEEMETEIKKYFSSYTILGLHGNDSVKKYYKDNQTWVDLALKYDKFELHKKLPSWLLTLPYNIITSIMRKQLLKQDERSASISTHDFFLSDRNLHEAIDIFVIATK
ncbi:MAG: class I SAM-dependent methyltransferase [Bacteroidota bacterium]